MSSYILHLINQFGGIDFVISLVAPLVLAVIYQRHWSTKTKTNATWVASLVTAAITTAMAGQLRWDWSDLGAVVFNFAVILGGTTIAHDKFYKPTGITPAIEGAVPSIGAPPVTAGAEAETADAIEGLLAALAEKAVQKYFPQPQPVAAPPSGAAAVPNEPQAQLGGPTIPADPLANTIYANPPVPVITQAPSAGSVAATPLPLPDKLEKVEDPYDPQAG